MYDWVGWVATGLFTLSYFVKRRGTLLRLQAVAAAVWLTYGILLNAMPVIVANVIVTLSAGIGAFRAWREDKRARPSALPPT
jgi:hypothetical protein